MSNFVVQILVLLVVVGLATAQTLPVSEGDSFRCSFFTDPVCSKEVRGPAANLDGEFSSGCQNHGVNSTFELNGKNVTFKSYDTIIAVSEFDLTTRVHGLMIYEKEYCTGEVFQQLTEPEIYSSACLNYQATGAYISCTSAAEALSSALFSVYNALL